MMSRIAVVFLAVAVCFGGAAGLAAGGDGSILLYPETEEQTVEPGESVEIPVIVSHHGTTFGEGLENVTLVAEYDDSVLTLQDAEPAGWFETGDSTGEIRTETDHNPGQVVLEQRVEPADGGVIATAQFATLQFEVAEDPSVDRTEIDLQQSGVVIAGGLPSPVFETNAQLIIESGASTDDSGDGAGDESSDDEGAFPVPPAVLAISILFVLLAVRFLQTERIE